MNDIRRNTGWGFVVAAVIAVIIVIVLLLVGCGEEGDSFAGSGDCTGTVTKTYTEYHAGVGIQSGNLNIPTGSTRYYIAIEKSDGTFCSKKLDKDEWLGITEGDTYG